MAGTISLVGGRAAAARQVLNLNCSRLSARAEQREMLWRIRRNLSDVRNLGLTGFVKLFLWCWRGRGQASFTLGSRYSRHPLWCRRGTSDFLSFRQIFVDRDYRCLDDLKDLDLVIDCGANVGYSSAYFLSRYPACRVIALEPDPENFRLLSQNLAPYRERVQLLQTGIWCRPTALKLSERTYREGNAWNRQVRECGDGEKADFTAVDMPTVLELAGDFQKCLVKIDVEGAEAVVFGVDCQAWLSQLEAVVVELHDDSIFGPASQLARAQLARQFRLGEFSDLTIGRRMC